MRKILTVLALGLVGGAISQVLTYIETKRYGSRGSILRAAIIVLVAGTLTAIYFTFIDHVQAGVLAIVQYGLFIALLADEIASAMKNESQRPGTAVASGATAAAPVAPILVLNGFWPVYGVGAFGGFVSELYQLYSRVGKKRRAPYSPLDWAVLGAMILVSGLITALHGVNNVSGLLAVQLGASTPLIIRRYRK